MPDPNTLIELTEQDVERVRMAVAEAGYPNDEVKSIRRSKSGTAIEWGWWTSIPRAVIRKARMLAGVPAAHCFICSETWPRVGQESERRAHCLGSEIDPYDCGAYRGAPDA